MKYEDIDEIEDELDEIDAICRLLIFSDTISIIEIVPCIANIICKKVKLLKALLYGTHSSKTDV